jgi:hypothetical protein
VNETLDDLIQRALEGEVTADERTRLEARLAAEPAARIRYDELSRAFEALGSVPLAEPPAGMRDEVMRAVRGAAPAWAAASARAGRSMAAPRPARRAGRPAFAWLRIALPLAAGAAAALVLIANWQGSPWRTGGERVSGTMSGLRSTDALRLGEGASAVLVRWNPSRAGFELRLQAGDTPVQVVLETPTAGATLSLASAAPAPSTRVETALAANAVGVVLGTAPGARATVRVRVTRPDGTTASGEVGLQGLRPAR